MPLADEIAASSSSSTIPTFLSLNNFSLITSFSSNLKIGNEIAEQFTFEFVYEAFFITCKKSSFCSFGFICFFILSIYFISLFFFLFRICLVCKSARRDAHRALRNWQKKMPIPLADEPTTSSGKFRNKLRISNTSEFKQLQKMLM
jgi:hypothetical protein